MPATATPPIRTDAHDPADGAAIGSKGETLGKLADAKGAKEAGHAGHSKAADSQRGLPGGMPRAIKVALLGAGSGFCPTLMRDLLLIPGGGTVEVALIDLDESRLGMMKRVVQKLVEAAGKEGEWTVTATTDRRAALPGCDYVINSIEVSGLACVRFDNDIPAKYGVDQCIGDTLGPGGLFKSLRTGPVFLDIVRDVRDLCPAAMFLNYTNPMSALCLAAGRAVPEVSLVGLCHSVQGTGHLLAKRAGVDYGEMEWACAGINHLAWFTTLKHNGKDLYPVLMDKARADLAGNPSDAEDAKDLVRKDMMLHFGAFITESSGHLSEYLPYYRKRKDLLEKYARDGYDGGSSFYANNWPDWRKKADETRQKMVDGTGDLPKLERSWEYASWIIEAREKDHPIRLHGNVMNVARPGSPLAFGGPLISNLPHDGCVEVACYVDRAGLHPSVYGPLPPQMAGVCASNMRYFDLVAEAIIHRSKEAAIYALLLDPLTSAVCSPAEIKAMAAELFEAEAAYLPGFE